VQVKGKDMEPHAVPADPIARFDPADWEFRVRRDRGQWLARPAPVPGEPPSNAETWTRRIPDGWSFDTAAGARAAAIAHGIDPAMFSVIPAPRRPGEWLAAGNPARS
jgi:hypothetical protein